MPSCYECRFFTDYNSNHSEGACRRHAPIIHITSNPYGSEPTRTYPTTLWPTVHYSHFCGDFEQKEKRDGGA
jgi:hypothetical protein